MTGRLLISLRIRGKQPLNGPTRVCSRRLPACAALPLPGAADAQRWVACRPSRPCPPAHGVKRVLARVGLVHPGRLPVTSECQRPEPRALCLGSQDTPRHGVVARRDRGQRAEVLVTACHARAAPPHGIIRRSRALPPNNGVQRTGGNCAASR